MRKFLLRLAGVLIVLIAGIYVFNASWRVAPPDHPEIRLIAHRGVHQQFDNNGLGSDGCSAARIETPTHAYFENTLPAMRAAFASRTSFVEARSTRDDAFNFGSAPGERLARGDAIRKVFGRIRATVHLHDAVRVGTIGTHGGWGAANVDFTDAEKDGTDVTQTFRVLAVWLNESAGWRIVQTQWSNAR